MQRPRSVLVTKRRRVYLVTRAACLVWWAGQDSNLRIAFASRVYSPVPLTTRPPTHGGTRSDTGHPRSVPTRAPGLDVRRRGNDSARRRTQVVEGTRLVSGQRKHTWVRIPPSAHAKSDVARHASYYGVENMDVVRSATANSAYADAPRCLPSGNSLRELAIDEPRKFFGAADFARSAGERNRADWSRSGQA
jgi:hypothetical protein